MRYKHKINSALTNFKSLDKRLKTFSLFTGILLYASQICLADSLTMTSYYPAPIAAFDHLQLAPHDNSTGDWVVWQREGTIYYDNTPGSTTENQLVLSKLSSVWVPLQGYWTQKNNYLYYPKNYANPLPFVGIGTDTPLFKLSIDYGNTTPGYVPDGGIIAKGTSGAGTSAGNFVAGTYLIWSPRDSAFRAGQVIANPPGPTTLGLNSAAFGFNTTANGSGSSAFGEGAVASGTNSTAMGQNTTASNSYATALGATTVAAGQYSTAMGFGSHANGNNSTAMGYNTTVGGAGVSMGKDTTVTGSGVAMGDGTTTAYGLAVGDGVDATGGDAIGYQTKATGLVGNAVAMGYQTTASGSFSTAIGNQATASGQTSVALGYKTTAAAPTNYDEGATAIGSYARTNAKAATAIGFATYAQAYMSTAIGSCNAAAGDSSNWIATDPIFVVGNGQPNDYAAGTCSSNRNALTIYKNGVVQVVNMPQASAPTCTSAWVGSIFFDTTTPGSYHFKGCVQTGVNTYSWRQLDP